MTQEHLSFFPIPNTSWVGRHQGAADTVRSPTSPVAAPAAVIDHFRRSYVVRLMNANAECVLGSATLKS